MSKPVRKAVFPAAGLGTRFLPATKAQPKEMLPVVDKPIIQYGVEEMKWMTSRLHNLPPNSIIDDVKTLIFRSSLQGVRK